jgi:hypothetical protein
MTPDADSASAGTCNPFTVTVKNSAGNPATSTVDVVITQRNNGVATAADTFDVNFCTTNTTTPNQTPANQASSGTPTGAAPTANADTDTRRGEFTPAADGTFTFGVIGTEPGTADIVAFLDNNNNNAIDSGENFDTSVKTFTAGTSADIRSLTASPKAATNFIGETHIISATLKNASGDTVAGATPTADITAGPNNATTPTCGTSNNDGVAQCSYAGGTVGTDTIVVFVNQTNADNNPATPDTSGPDAGEPQDTVQKTWQTAPTGLTIDLTCGDGTTARSGPEDCFNQLSDNNETFSALVKRADGSLASGVLVSFAVTGDTVPTSSTDAAPVLSAAEATTNASGVATVTLTDPQPVNNEQVTVTATVRGQSPVTSDDARKTWRTVTTGERNIVISPKSATTTVGTFRTFSAKVTNVNGEPVQGATVRFDETGAGAFRNGNSQTFVDTNINGIATVDVTAGPNETGTETITATLTNQTECVKLAGNPAGSTAGNCTDTATNNFTAAGSPSPSTSPGSARPVLSTSTPDIQPNIQGIYTATGASPNSVLELRCYTRPSTTYFTARSTTVNATGSPVEFRILPGANTRCYARPAGNDALASNSVVINVHTTLSLSTVRTGVRTYIFQGRNLPRRAGQLITLYRITSSGQEIRTSNLTTDSSGIYRVTRKFTGTGTFRFRVRTTQTLNNAAGASNIITVTIH